MDTADSTEEEDALKTSPKYTASLKPTKHVALKNSRYHILTFLEVFTV